MAVLQSMKFSFIILSSCLFHRLVSYSPVSNARSNLINFSNDRQILEKSFFNRPIVSGYKYWRCGNLCALKQLEQDDRLRSVDFLEFKTLPENAVYKNKLSTSQSSSNSDRLINESHENVTEFKDIALLMFLCFMVAVVCALDRVAMSIAILPMSSELGYSETTKGLIASAFSWGYMIFMIPAGILGTFFSPKTVMGLGVFLWSIAQMLSPACAIFSLPTLLICRFAMGMGESVTIPLIQEIVYKFVPENQRTRWLALIISGLQVGTVLAYVASPSIVNSFNWEGIFYAYGFMGIVWLLFWQLFAIDAGSSSYSSVQEDSSRVLNDDNSVQEDCETVLDDDSSVNGVYSSMHKKNYRIVYKVNRLVHDDKSSVLDPISGFTDKLVEVDNSVSGIFASLKAVPWIEFCTDKNIWCIAGAHMAHNWGLYFMLAWLPTYFNQEFGLNLSESSGASVMPWVVGAVVGNAAGWLGDYLVNSNIMEKTTVRRMFQTIALLGPSVCMYILSGGSGYSENLNLNAAQELFVTAVALGSCSSVGFGSSVQDLNSKYTSIIYALTSAVSVVAGSIGTVLTGVILDNTHSWSPIFELTAIVYAFGALWYGSSYIAEPRVEK